MPSIIAQHTVPPNSERQRLSDYCCGIFEALPSRKGVKKAIKAGRIYLDGSLGQTGDWVEAGQQIQLLADNKSRAKVYERKLEVLFENEFFAVINKPAGIPVSGNQFKTISNMLAYNLQPSNLPDALANPYPLHRLDALTSGLLLIAKTAGTQLHLGTLFAQRKIQKSYQAIVCGQIPESGVLDSPIEGKPAISRYTRLAVGPSLKNENLSLVELHPVTGRTHQLRIHLAQLGHPIMGDQLYGEVGKIYQGKGLFLAATALSFVEPITKEVFNFVIDPPTKFGKLLEREAGMWRKFNL